MGLLGIALGIAVAQILPSRTNPDSTARDDPASLPTLRLVIDLPASAPLAIGEASAVGFAGPVVALSPDATRLVYVGQSSGGTMLYSRELAGPEVVPLAGTEGAIHPFFSPDGQWVGFLTDDRVKKVSMHGGSVTTLARAQNPIQAWWTPGDLIYFSEAAGRRISRVPADGGAGPTRITDGTALRQGFHDGFFSDVLPDGRTFLATRYPRSISAEFGEIVAVSTDTDEARPLIRFGYGAQFVPPRYVVFGRGGSLLAVRFDPERLEVEAEEVVLARGVSMNSLWNQVYAAVTSHGLVAYVGGGDLGVGRLGWVRRDGIVESLDAPPRIYGTLDIDPNGRRLAVTVADVTDYIWVYDFERREGRRLAGTPSYSLPLLNPDGRTIALTSFDGQTFKGVVQRLEEGTEPTDVLPEPGGTPESWSGDGLTLSFSRGGRIGFVSPGQGTTTTSIEGIWSSLSPDGRWFAYTSVNQQEVWVASYPDATIRRRISDNGKETVWCGCGDLFYRWGSRWFSTRVSTNGHVRWDPPRQAFETDFVDTPGVSYDVSPDGRRLLVVKPVEPAVQTKIHLVVTNWEAWVGRGTTK